MLRKIAHSIKWLIPAVSLLWLSGCVALPPVQVSDSIEADELEDHVRFLSQPSLRGRKTGSWEAPIVRRYLLEHFDRYGLIPWGNAEGFEQDFRIGKNIIGILPGSDPNLANEMILVSAHYDHLGAGLFKTYPGACDNASGVAVLLELAERMSQAGSRPRRSVCFASFDAEEIGCLGSFAFTCRDDYDDSQIAAVINMDLLGRDFLEVVDNSLLVVGSERFPILYEQIKQAARDPNVRILPFKSDLVGPVGDHIAFLSSERPVLFFTCGLYRDYHRPTDTADKLNFEKIRREASVVYHTLDYLANVSQIEEASAPDPSDPQSLRSLAVVLDGVDRNKEVFQFDPNELQTLQSVRNLVSKAIEEASVSTTAQQAKTERHVLKKMLPLLQRSFPGIAKDAQLFLEVSELFSLYPEIFTKFYRDILRQVLAQKPSLFRKTILPNPLQLGHTDSDWILAQEPNGLYLASVQSTFRVKINYSIFLRSLELTTRTQIDICKGTRAEIIDYVFLKLINSQNDRISNATQTGTSDPNGSTLLWENAVPIVEDPNDSASFWKQVLVKVPPKTSKAEARPWIQTHYNPADPNTLFTRWLWALCTSPNPFLAEEAIRTSARIEGNQFEGLWRRLLLDPNVPPQVRSRALMTLCGHKTRRSLLAVVEILEDTTKYPILEEVMKQTFPLRDHPLVAPLLPHWKESLKSYQPQTLGSLAVKQLHEHTRKNFGTNEKRWERWIRRTYPD